MKKVERYYDENSMQEWERLEKHLLEFEVTKKILDENIEPNSKILDIGSGPGRYSIYLAQKGHKVTLVDISKKNLELAKQKAEEMNVVFEDYIHADALDLAMFEDETFDCVLNFGPMYHITDERERSDAMAETLRVLRKRGVVFVSFISNYAPIIDMLKNYPEESNLFAEDNKKFLLDGINISSEVNPGFTDAYFISSNEIMKFMEQFFIRNVQVNAIEALAGIREEVINTLDEKALKAWVDLIYEIGQDPHTWASSEHFVYTGMKI
jgi:ubiquinone/menaquinone biosynthesis C-methylase UbiE